MTLGSSVMLMGNARPINITEEPYSCSTVYRAGDPIHHDEVGHYETRTVTAAYDEQVLTGYKCNCGATRDP